MARHFSGRFLAGLAAAGIAGMVLLTGCGRKGALERPSSAMTENEKGDPVPKPGEDKPFILDRLIK